MTLRTTALIAGALGLLLLIGGLIADAMRPAAFGTPSASLDTPVLLLGPEMVAMAPGGTITVEGTSEITAYSGRVEDAEAWAATRSATVVTGVPTWEELATDSFAEASPEPSASATADAAADPSASASAQPSGSAEASASPSAEPGASAAPVEIADIWRDSWTGEDGTLVLDTDTLPVGLEIVVESTDGSPLSAVSMRIDRVVNDSWVKPLKLWGGFLAIVGLIALVFLFIDHRHAGSKVETAVASRKPAAPATPGGRRERREALTASGGIPLVTAEEDPTTGEHPLVEGTEHDAPRDGHDDEEDRA
ncbi:hypothetical protein [Demequina gelatinilytica]|uniref:hypothetical protein n=1 Tax=Demequina gelatinilytica TaxID=1638980 RepID=UPI000AA6FB95|nr:hypothetical protein [Demequina gelatinilytica]